MPVSPSTPNLLILGAPKCATTSLHHYLAQHPEVFMTDEKEPHFFDEAENYAKGVEHYLRCHFAGADAFKVRGESTPAYLRRHESVIPRIKQSLDCRTLRFIVLLRDPVQRAWSHFLHTRRRGRESEPFARALELERERTARGCAGWHGYFSDGLYARQLSAWLEHFPRESFLILLTEDLRRDEPRVLEQTCGFLEIEPGFHFDTHERHNRADWPRLVWLPRLLDHPNALKDALRLLAPRSLRRRLSRKVRELNLGAAIPELDAELARELRARYRSEVVSLERILGRDLSSWK